MRFHFCNGRARRCLLSSSASAAPIEPASRANEAGVKASRDLKALNAFAAERGLDVVGWFVENESGARLDRPKLFRLIADSEPMLIEQIDRRRLRKEHRDQLKAERLRHEGGQHQAATGASKATIMMLNVLAAMAAKDYTDRRRRQAEGM